MLCKPTYPWANHPIGQLVTNAGRRRVAARASEKVPEEPGVESARPPETAVKNPRIQNGYQKVLAPLLPPGCMNFFTLVPGVSLTQPLATVCEPCGFNSKRSGFVTGFNSTRNPKGTVQVAR